MTYLTPSEVVGWRAKAAVAVNTAFGRQEMVDPLGPENADRTAALTEWYTELEPVNKAAWRLVMDNLVEFGGPLRYRSENDGRHYRSPLSTGMLSLTEAVERNGEAVGAAIRLRAEDQGDEHHRQVQAALRAHQGAKTFEARAQAMQDLENLIRGVQVDTWNVSDTEVLPPILAIRTERELAYPRPGNSRDHALDDSGHHAEARVSALLRDVPEVFTWPLNAFGGGREAGHYVDKPGEPKLTGDPEVAMELARAQAENNAVVADMLLHIGRLGLGPLSFDRRQPAIHR